MTTTCYCFGATPVADFAALCACLGGNKLQSPYRSTVPLLSLVHHSRPQWDSLLTSLGAGPAPVVYFEYCVPSPKPGGNPSQTDALLLTESMVWAIEAKWTEPRYESVATRLRKPEADGGDPRITLNGWLAHLQPFATRALRLDDFSDVVYQTLHRAASACAVATEQDRDPVLLYLHFHPSPLKSSASTNDYLSDLGRLDALLGSPSRLKFAVVEMPLLPTSAFEAIKDLDKTSRATATRVSEALCARPLFTFGQPTVKMI